jgi:dihydrofolate synthase / folylpolyglutamate synthase
MNYEETIAYLYNLLPVFHRIGAKAYKADLSNTRKICEYLGNPQTQFKSIHVAGTNGKGSTSHFLASILQSAGYKVGLYTSPHLKSFTERVRINGKPIENEIVVDFVATHKSFIEQLQPSFFELTVGLAFQIFAHEKVDIAVIEVGLGGLLDSTNVIEPELSVITNISYDHTDILGKTLPAIASQKAGIIKKNVPVVISEIDPETQQVFIDMAQSNQSHLTFAPQHWQVLQKNRQSKGLFCEIQENKIEKKWSIISELRGDFQDKNILGVLQACSILRSLDWQLTDQAILEGFAQVITRTGLKGRWQQLQEEPLIICDIAHNKAGIEESIKSIQLLDYESLYFILGFVKDKDIEQILRLLPLDASYIFCQADSPRSLPAEELWQQAQLFGLQGQVIIDVNEAIEYVKKKSNRKDFVYIGGSNFVVAEIENL